MTYKYRYRDRDVWKDIDRGRYRDREPYKQGFGYPIVLVNYPTRNILFERPKPTSHCHKIFFATVNQI